MRELALVRHGQAVDRAATDAARPLTDQGRGEAQAAGELLARRRGSADLALHSAAVRTLQTWQEMAPLLGLTDEDVWPAPAVYEAGVPDLLRALADVPQDAAHVVLVGHAPGVPALVGHLTGHWPQAWHTGQVGVIGLPDGLGWADLHEGCGQRLG